MSGTNGTPASEENPLWANPCSYQNPTTQKPAIPNQNISKLASKVSIQAESVFLNAKTYEDHFANITHSYPNFTELIDQWKGYSWLKSRHWVKEDKDVFPDEKYYGQNVSEERMDEIMARKDVVLPKMFKSMKLVLAGFANLTERLSNSDDELKKKLKATKREIQSVLCYFYDFMKAKDLEMLPLYSEDIPVVENTLELAVLVFRDAINYTELMFHVFKRISEAVPQ